MGIQINKKIETIDGNHYDNFYMRIEGYWFHKSVGQLQIALNHYKDKAAAEAALPPFIDDKRMNDASGQIPLSCSFDDGVQVDLSQLHHFHLTSSEKVPVIEWEKWEEVKEQEIELIDYNDNGDEIKTYDIQLVPVEVSASKTVYKTRINAGELDGNIFTYSYSRIKKLYSETFGEENLQNI
jgi:hypothetical protein